MQFVIQVGYLVHKFPLFRPVQCSEQVGALEHEMFKIVGHTGVVGRIVLATGVYAYGTPDFGL